MSTAGTRYFSLAPQETADWLFDGLSSRDPRGPQLTGHVFRSGDGERGSWDRGKVRCRRNFAVQPDCVERPFSAMKAVIHCVGTCTLVAIGADHFMGSPFALIWAARRARFIQ